MSAQIQELLPSVPFIEHELRKLAEVFSDPIVIKYLQSMALEDTKELLAFSAISKTDQELAKAHATVQGKLSVISTLLSIPQINKE